MCTVFNDMQTTITGLFITSSDSCLISLTMDEMGRLLSRPLVKGTMQYVHMLSHPRIMDLAHTYTQNAQV